MKIFAIQKTQTNTYSPEFKQNSSVNQGPVMKTNHSGDKFVSSNRVSFGATLKQLEAELEVLERKLESKTLSKSVREALEKQIKRLKVKIEMTSGEGVSLQPPRGDTWT